MISEILDRNESTSSAKLIMILGIMGRSGTNYLRDLICLHPDCCPSQVWEDYLLAHSELLDLYVKAVTAHWNERSGKDANTLFRWLEHALVALLSEGAGSSRVVTKTPTVRNLENVLGLFPQARVLIIVRDGRSVVESGVRSKFWTYEMAMRRWAENAGTIVAFSEANKHREDSFKIVRYEDLLLDLQTQLESILTFLDLNVGLYDFQAATSLPVRGSSDLTRSAGTVHWQPVTRPTEFSPSERWRSWNRRLHERFNHLAGPNLVALGYRPQTFEGDHFFWSVWNAVQDLRWAANQKCNRFRSILRARIRKARI